MEALGSEAGADVGPPCLLALRQAQVVDFGVVPPRELLVLHVVDHLLYLIFDLLAADRTVGHRRMLGFGLLLAVYRFEQFVIRGFLGLLAGRVTVHNCATSNKYEKQTIANIRPAFSERTTRAVGAIVFGAR